MKTRNVIWLLAGLNVVLLGAALLEWQEASFWQERARQDKQLAEAALTPVDWGNRVVQVSAEMHQVDHGKAIRGKIRNDSGRVLAHVRLRYNVSTYAGMRIDTAWVNLYNVAPGAVLAFQTDIVDLRANKFDDPLIEAVE